MRLSAFRVIKTRLLGCILIAHTAKTTSYVKFYVNKVKNVTFKDLKRIQLLETISKIIKCRFCLSPKLIMKKNTNVLLVKSILS